MLKNKYTKNKIEAGCDEAGRGCLAGPVYAAAVILPDDFNNEMLNDSKQINEKNREELRKIIEEQSISWAVGVVDNNEIDEINILNASILAMHRAIDKLSTYPDLLLIDGNKFKPYRSVEHICVIKGDGKFNSIAAASILAKTHRDEHMKQMAKKFPQYQWDKNKAYPTKFHKEAIQKHGITEFHRKSFKLFDPLTLNF